MDKVIATLLVILGLCASVFSIIWVPLFILGKAPVTWGIYSLGVTSLSGLLLSLVNPKKTGGRPNE